MRVCEYGKRGRGRARRTWERIRTTIEGRTDGRIREFDWESERDSLINRTNITSSVKFERWEGVRVVKYEQVGVRRISV